LTLSRPAANLSTVTTQSPSAFGISGWRWWWLPAPVIAVFLGLSVPARADVPPLFRLFLRDGTIVTCLGEYARVGERVVFTLPLGDAAASALMSLPENTVDWVKTDQYAESLRTARYADSRGEADFAGLAGEVAAVLNEIAMTSDASRRVQLALDARRRLDAWPREHYNYRAADVGQIVQLVDEAITEFRAAAGEQQFDLSLVATPVPSAPVPLLDPPSPEATLTSALAVAEKADNPSERLSLLESLSHAIDQALQSLPASAGARLQQLVRGYLHTERAVDSAYSSLAASANTRAHSRATRADVRGVERVIAQVRAQDTRLGSKRPERVSALMGVLQEELDAARRLRLARDQWSIKVVAYRSYRRALARPLGELALMTSGLDDIKRLAGPAAADLPRLAKQATTAIGMLGSIVPPTDLASAHALVQSAAQLAAQAVRIRSAAVSGGTMNEAWQASSAAAGALMLLARAKQDLDAALVPPGLR
jgi:hypothetical protein